MADFFFFNLGVIIRHFAGGVFSVNDALAGLLELRDKWNGQLLPPGEVNRESVFIVIGMLTSKGTDVSFLFRWNQVFTLKEKDVCNKIISMFVKSEDVLGILKCLIPGSIIY